jgi:excinuclease UvrABC nuclease subunit
MATLQFNPEDWLTPNSYGDNYAELPHGAGIYILVRATWRPVPKFQVLYVGMSTNIAQRLKGHEIKKLCDDCNGATDYVQTYFRAYPKDVLRRRERRLIKAWNPPYNLQHRERGEG